MSDLRQGVTEPVHAVLDRVDALRGTPSAAFEPRMLLLAAEAAGKRSLDLSHRRDLRRQDAIDACARMLLMFEALDAELQR